MWPYRGGEDKKLLKAGAEARPFSLCCPGTVPSVGFCASGRTRSMCMELVFRKLSRLVWLGDGVV